MVGECALSYAGWVTAARSRARRLAPEDRRRALVDATLPLVREHGLAVSTRQIAEAAGGAGLRVAQ